jgi:hypothetical protein
MSGFVRSLSLFTLSTLLGASGAPLRRQVGVTAIDPATTDSFTPFSFYAATGYCKAKDTLTWSCGQNCDANPGFQPTASGGNGITTQFCKCLLWTNFPFLTMFSVFVGYDPALDTVIVSHQGTDPDKMSVPLLLYSGLYLTAM